MCDNILTQFDDHAVDVDGDSLAYSIVSGLSGATTFEPAPGIAPPPPYFELCWVVDYSLFSPLGIGSVFEIDSDTGVITAAPIGAGLYILGVNIEEFRAGVSLGSTRKNMTVRVLNANANVGEKLQGLHGLITNPINGNIDLSDFEGVESITIYDIKGKMYLEKSNLELIDFQFAPNGIYFVKLKVKDRIFSQKLIKI